MEIKAPDLGVDSAEVSEIMVSVGDVIEVDDNIVLLESDKASVEVPSSAAGKVTRIAVNVGDQVSEGSVIIEIEAQQTSNDDDHEKRPEPEDLEDTEASADSTQQTQQMASATNTSSNAEDNAALSSQTYSLPDLGVDEAQVAEIMVEVGDEVEVDQSILLIESDKASVEVPAPITGTVDKILVANGDTVKNGQAFIVITGNSSATKSNSSSSSDQKAPKATSNDSNGKAATINAHNGHDQSSASEVAEADSAASNSEPNQLSESAVNAKLANVYAGPAVRKLARQLGVDITQVSGSASNNRVIKEDLFDYVKSQIKGGSASQAGSLPLSSGLPNLPDMSKTEIWGETETIALSRLQKVSIPQLNYNTYLPQVTQFDLADITDTEALRGELKGEFKQQGIGLTILAFIVKATAYALTQHPKFNSHLSDDNTQIIVRKSVNMGIAVATDDGLIVPVIKDAQDKGIKQLAIEIGELAAKARDKKLGTKDLQGASFTISSQGNLGGTYFTPLVNWPQVAILGISEASMQPRWNDHNQGFEPRLMLPLSLSYDHRVINGADAAVFTRYIAKLLADPRRILL